MLNWVRQGEGPDVVLVHGFLGGGRIFDPLTEHLKYRFTVTTLDLPGFAGSVDIPVPSSVEELSLLVADTILSIGINHCSVLGHSLGAMIALEISLQRPTLLDGMVIYGGCPDGYLPKRFETTEQSVQKIQSQGIETVAADIAANWFQRGRRDPMYPLARTAGEPFNEEAAIAHVKMWDSWKARDRLGKVQAPTLIICGDSDRSTHPDLSVEMWSRIQHAQLFIAPDAGHAVHLEYPEIFNTVVERFLTLTENQKSA